MAPFAEHDFVVRAKSDPILLQHVSVEEIAFMRTASPRKDPNPFNSEQKIVIGLILCAHERRAERRIVEAGEGSSSDTIARVIMSF